MKLRPLHDRVIIKRLEEERKTASGIVIPDTAAEKPDQGEVLAVGPGKKNEYGKLVQSLSLNREGRLSVLVSLDDRRLSLRWTSPRQGPRVDPQARPPAQVPRAGPPAPTAPRAISTASSAALTFRSATAEPLPKSLPSFGMASIRLGSTAPMIAGMGMACSCGFGREISAPRNIAVS